MRKGLRMLLLGALFTVLLCTTALAADSGIVANSLKPVDATKVTLTAKDSGGNTVQAGDTVYPNAVQVGMDYSGATAGNQYLAFVLNDDTRIPTANNIVYIDQVQASGTSANFNLYPSSLVSGKTYNIWLSSNEEGGSLQKVGSFDYYAPYVRGDADGSGVVDVDDATAIINYIISARTLEGNQLLAADVDINTGTGTVDVFDATKILNFLIGSITSL